MVLTVTEDTPADMLAGSMELLVQLPLDHHVHTQRVTVLRSTPMMDLLVQIATAHKLTASSYTLQAIGERGLVLPHHPNTPIGALDALQVKLLPKQGTCVSRKTKQTNQPFETTFRLQVHLPRNQLYVSRVSPKMNLGEILDEVCREKNLDRNKYELRHPANLEETLDLALSLQDYHLQEVTLYAKQARTLGPTLSTQDIMALQRQEERRRQQTKQSVFGFMFKKSKESSLSTDSLGGRSVSPARSDETGRSASPLQPPARPQRKRRPAPKPPTDAVAIDQDSSEQDSGKDKMVINHSRNSSDSSGYHEASVLSDNPDSAARLPETLPRRSKAPGVSDAPRKLAQTSQSSKSLGNLAVAAAAATATGGGTLTRGISSTSLSSTGLRKKRAAPPPPAPRPLSSAISTQALERIVDSEESLTSDMDPSKPPSDIGAPSKASSDIACPKANSDIGVSTQSMRQLDYKAKAGAVAAVTAIATATVTCESDESNVPQQSVEARSVKSDPVDHKPRAKVDPEVAVAPVEAAPRLEQARVAATRVGEPAPLPMPRKINVANSAPIPPKAPKRKVAQPPLALPRTLSTGRGSGLSREERVDEAHSLASSVEDTTAPLDEGALAACTERGEEAHSKSRDKCAPPGEDESSQRQRKLSGTISDVAAEDDASLRPNQCHREMESNVESDCKSTGPIHVEAEETRSKIQEHSPEEGETRQDERVPNVADDVKDLKSFSPDQSSNRDEEMLNVADDSEGLESSNQKQSSSHDEDTARCELNSVSAGQSVSSRSMLSLEVTSERQEDGLSERDREGRRENVDSHGESENQRARASSEDDCLNESVTKPDRVAEPSKVERTKPLRHYRAVCPERPPRSPRKTIPGHNAEENVETAKQARPGNATVKSGALGKDREICTVISTIPKCERLDDIKEHGALPSFAASTDRRQRLDERSQVKRATEVGEECQKSNGKAEEPHDNARSAKRAKVVRSQSKSDDFQMDILKRQRRYLTSPPENIVYALNLNLPEARTSMSSHAVEKEREQPGAGRYANGTREVDVDKGEPCGGLVTAAKDGTPSETDILLQKVSDTLSNALPPTSPPPEPSQLEYTNSTSVQTTNDIPNVSINSKPSISKDQPNEISSSSCVDFPADTLSSSTPNMTTNSQQDTSDYVSAMGEDLSMSDWEYQLPAPPSAFRDSHSPIFDNYDTVTLGSVEAFKEPLVLHSAVELADATDSCSRNDKSKNKGKSKNLLNDADVSCAARKATSEKTDPVSEMEIDDKAERATNKQSVSHKSETNADPRKEIISELENKIENGTLAQSVGKDFDRRYMDNVSAPKIAPVDNTLSNFTITTYTKQKSLDIFDEFEESVDYTRGSDERFIKTFATLSRGNAGVSGYENKNGARNTGRLVNSVSSHDNMSVGKSAEEPNASNNADCKTEPKIRNQDEPPINRWQSLNATNNEKANNVQRSKSYISMTNSAKYQTEAQAMSERKYEPYAEVAEMKKATSVSSLNVDAPRTNEKFSQWRDNILKHQEESTKEKQLQSLQVLKSILPQLKNAQQAEENVSKEYNSALLIEKTKYEAGSNEHSSKTNVVSTRESRDTETAECRQSSREEGTKRYIYAGPPAISLGSWSERPSVNVQIKMDTDYKLGRSNANGNKTVVNINGAKEERDTSNYTNNNNSGKYNVVKHEIKIDSKSRDELSQKSLIAHTTASGFKKPLTNRVNVSVDSMRTDEDRPVVTGVELKKSFVEVKETPKNGESEIDTTPVNFRELTKTFGQHVNFKPKPKRANVNRHSADCHGAQLEEMDMGIKQNGHAKFARASNENENLPHKGQSLMNGTQQNSRLRKFTSVVGVNGTGQSFGQHDSVVLRSNVNNNVKINPPMPVVKGFKKISVNDTKRNGQMNQNGVSAIDGFRKDVQPPKPPTMPVITGVTLKSASARPKSMPAQLDPRDMLLESIRNFGREKLKNTAERF